MIETTGQDRSCDHTAPFILANRGGGVQRAEAHIVLMVTLDALTEALKSGAIDVWDDSVQWRFKRLLKALLKQLVDQNKRSVSHDG